MTNVSLKVNLAARERVHNILQDSTHDGGEGAGVRSVIIII